MTGVGFRLRQQASGDSVRREVAGHHDQAVLNCSHVGWALAIHRAAPALTVVELLKRAAQPGPVRRALEHARGCAHCGVGQLCETDERLAKQIKPTPARTRGWLALRSAAVAQARARKREGAA